MDIITGAVVVSSLSIVGAILNKTPYGKIQSCIDTYTFAGNDTWRDSDAFVSCMKGQFPSEFGDAYKRKLQAQKELKTELNN